MKSFEGVEKLAAGSDNQYKLALAMSKRVRALRDGAPCLIPEIRDSQQNAVKAAMAEFSDGLISYEISSDENQGVGEK